MYGGDGELLYMAGLWSTWRPKEAPKDAPPLLSCTIITTDAAGPLAEIHDRMPLTISEPTGIAGSTPTPRSTRGCYAAMATSTA